METSVQKILTPDAIAFLSALHRRFNAIRLSLLKKRVEKQEELNKGGTLHFLPETAEIRDDTSWKVAPSPKELQKRWVEITGPVERKMMINALNSGADTFMADFEDSLSPTWKNVIEGQLNLTNAIDRILSFKSPEGKQYSLNEKTAVLLVRPRGWHLVEKHFPVDGVEISASLFDFGLYFFHNAKRLLTRGSAPYFYLPKMESYLEARLWNDVFNFAQDELKVPRGTISATVLIETLPAAFEMEEILYELREHCAGLNAGRWDYIFSIIKKFQAKQDFNFPDRGQITMGSSFMRAYAESLVKVCHKRGAHAMGGMSAFIPSRKDKEVNENALKKVREDKTREIEIGFDGTWVAHPDLVSIASDIFKEALQDKPHQKEKLPEKKIKGEELLNFSIPNGKITEGGIRQNINVSLQYLASWLRGIGAAAIDNLMEDAATAEISRSQLWQWIHHGATLENKVSINLEFYHTLADQEFKKLSATLQEKEKLPVAKKLLDEVVLNQQFPDFLTLVAYSQLD